MMAKLHQVCRGYSISQLWQVVISDGERDIYGTDGTKVKEERLLGVNGLP